MDTPIAPAAASSNQPAASIFPIHDAVRDPYPSLRDGAGRTAPVDETAVRRLSGISTIELETDHVAWLTNFGIVCGKKS